MMRSFRIQLERCHSEFATAAHAKWTIRQGGNELVGLCWDELIGTVARIGLLDWFMVPNSADRYWPQIIRSLDVTETQRGLWLVQSGPRFHDSLGFDEMLAFIAAWSRDGTEMFGGLKTYEEWAALGYRRLNHPVRALLT